MDLNLLRVCHGPRCAGVIIYQKYDIFAPPPISQKIFFSPRHSENFPFFPNFQPLPLFIRAFSFPFLFPNQPITHI